MTIYKYAAQFGGLANNELYQPVGITTDSAGNVYVADTGRYRIVKYSSSGSYIFQFGSLGTSPGQFQTPNSVAVDGAGNIYVTDSSTNIISKFDGTGHLLAQFGRKIPNYGYLNVPSGIAIGPLGNLYFCDSLDNQIVELDPQGNVVTHWGGIGSGRDTFYDPRAVAVDRAGNVYVADTASPVAGNDEVDKYDSSGRFLGRLNPVSLGSFLGVATDVSNNVYVTDEGEQRILKYASDGTLVASWTSTGPGNGGFASPYGIAVDQSGNVYVSDTGNFLAKWGGLGSGPGQFSSRFFGGGPLGIAVDKGGNVLVTDSGNNRVEVFEPVLLTHQMYLPSIPRGGPLAILGTDQATMP